MIRKGSSSAVSDALEGLAADLGTWLSPAGWTRQHLLPEKIAVFTHPVGEDSFFASVEILQVGLVRRRIKWPADLYVRYGCGHWPTLDLMPRVGLDVDPVLVEEPAAAGEAMPTARVANETDVDRVVDVFADQISMHGMDFATSLSTVAAMQSALNDDHLTPLEVRTELLPAFLYAVGRTAEAKEVAGRYLDERAADDQDDYGEFVRALCAVVEP